MSDIRTKSDVDMRRDGPAVNAKVYNYPESVSLPLALGVSYPIGEPEKATTHYTDANFTHEWIDANVPERTREAFWQHACEDGWEMAKEDAGQIFDEYDVTVYSDGRSGGWAVVSGLPDIESWDAIMLGKWKKFAKFIRGIADYVPESYLNLLYMNVYEPMAEEQEAEDNQEAAALLPIVGGE